MQGDNFHPLSFITVLDCQRKATEGKEELIDRWRNYKVPANLINLILLTT